MDKRIVKLTLACTLFFLSAGSLLAQDGGTEKSPEKLMERMDTDGNQLLSYSEAKGPIKNHFSRIDKNGDDMLSLDKLKNAQGKVKAKRTEVEGKSSEELIAKFDSDGNGSLSKEEAPEKMVKRFDRLDANKDGEIAADEMDAARAKAREMKGHRRP